MFDRFRQKYPQGSIISSLIQIHNDQYIVSVSIKFEGVVLATTLAAHEQIQMAESLAAAQALQTLNLDEPIDRLNITTTETIPPEPPVTTPAKVQEDTAAYLTTDSQLPSESLSVTDMIPLINMELKRLNWSREKGRDCIIELYNKRSSSLLSDEELLGLLRYLQAQEFSD